MTPARAERPTGAKFIYLAAAGVLVILGLRAGAAILLPSVLAVFLAILGLPLKLWMQKKGLPHWLATLLTVFAVVAAVSALIVLAGMSASELQRTVGSSSGVVDTLTADTVGVEAEAVPAGGAVERPPVGAPDGGNDLVARLVERRDQLVGWIARIQDEWNLPFEPGDAETMIRGLLNPSWVVDQVGGVVGRAAQVVSTAIIVFIIMAFMLIEASVLPHKLREAFGVAPAEGGRPMRIVREIRTYLVIKSAVSAVTGLTLGIFAHFMGLEFPILLGMIAFVLNYIPTVGSILAAVPAIALSLLIDGSVGHALTVALGYVVVNTIVGSIIEPNLMGRSLNISTLAVVLSLLFWGWVWGPLGALLSVPLTAMVKIWLEHTPDLRWAAILLGKGDLAFAAVPSGPDSGSSSVPAADVEERPSTGEDVNDR